MCENKALGIIFGPTRADTIERWRKLHNEELRKLYSPPNIRVTESMRKSWDKHVYTMNGDMRSVQAATF